MGCPSASPSPEPEGQVPAQGQAEMVSFPLLGLLSCSGLTGLDGCPGGLWGPLLSLLIQTLTSPRHLSLWPRQKIKHKIKRHADKTHSLC